MRYCQLTSWLKSSVRHQSTGRRASTGTLALRSGGCSVRFMPVPPQGAEAWLRALPPGLTNHFDSRSGGRVALSVLLPFRPNTSS